MKATIHLAPLDLRRIASCLTKEKLLPFTTAFRTGGYQERHYLTLPKMDEGAAIEECFDLTNNPSRQDERERRYGDYRSLSVGDIVQLDHDKVWICLSFGWHQIN